MREDPGPRLSEKSEIWYLESPEYSHVLVNIIKLCTSQSTHNSIKNINQIIMSVSTNIQVAPKTQLYLIVMIFKDEIILTYVL